MTTHSDHEDNDHEEAPRFLRGGRPRFVDS